MSELTNYVAHELDAKNRVIGVFPDLVKLIRGLHIWKNTKNATNDGIKSED